MVFNLIAGGGVSVEIKHGTFTKEGTGATFTISGLEGQPKFFAIYKVANTTTNGAVSFAVLVNGAYVGQSQTGDTGFSTRNKASNASWDATNNTFSISLWNSHGNYEYYYII